jgi:hypothetical protein
MQVATPLGGQYVKTTMLIVLLVLSGPTHARFYTSNQLLELCQSENVGHQNACRGFLGGVVDSVDILKAWGDLPSDYFCAPKTTSLSQLQIIYIKYSSNNPQYQDWLASSIAMNAFFLEFPC